MNRRSKAIEAMESIGAAATWHIDSSSEHCRITISGLAVLLTFDEAEHVFYDSDNGGDIAGAILLAADRYEVTCYPERGCRWL